MTTAWTICLICLLAIPAILLLCGVMRFAGCKKIGDKCGYSTDLSRSSKEAWAYAQSHSALPYVIVGAAMAVVSVMLMLKVPGDNVINAAIVTGIFILTQVLVWMLLISTVEAALHVHYGKKEA